MVDAFCARRRLVHARYSRCFEVIGSVMVSMGHVYMKRDRL